MRTIKFLGLAFILTVLFNSCKKVAIPDPIVNVVFGKWKYINSDGGFSGGSCWPTDKSIWIEFKENGHYKKHEHGKLTHSEKFTFKQVSGSNGSQIYVIQYEKNRTQTFKVSGDTLFLSDYGWADGCSYAFVKK
jgi:hypothetical protein